MSSASTLFRYLRVHPPALDLISTEMEEAAAIHGAGTLRTMLKVTLPLALPAILGAFILVFLESIALYGTPALIAIPARYNVATTQLASSSSIPCGSRSRPPFRCR